jgi:hypothetical protein
VLNLWVDPTTHLPTRVAVLAGSGISSRSTFKWLTPDASHLAQLVAPVPPGFRLFSGSGAGGGAPK